MAHILESIQDKNSVVGGNDVIHGQISSLLARMYDYKTLQCKTKEEKEIIDAWRTELTIIRSAIDRVNDV